MRVLLTAFEAYDEWPENSSWLTLVELLKSKPGDVELVTRLYPVDLAAVRSRLAADLESGFDAVLHLGQAPGGQVVKLEEIALNVAGCVRDNGEKMPPIVEAGPLAYQSQLPLGRWSQLLREHHVPAMVSYHAGTYLCNATFYLSHHWHQARQRECHIAFLHLPLTTRQVADASLSYASLPVETLALAVKLLLADLSKLPTPEPPQLGSV